MDQVVVLISHCKGNKTASRGEGCCAYVLLITVGQSVCFWLGSKLVSPVCRKSHQGLLEWGWGLLKPRLARGDSSSGSPQRLSHRSPNGHLQSIATQHSSASLAVQHCCTVLYTIGH